MVMRTKILAVAAMAAGMSLLAGCGGSGPRLVTVKGTVLRDGKPVEGAEVTFVPANDNAEGLPGGDVTGSAGDYYAMTRGRSGLVPGKYVVSVKKVKVDNPLVLADGSKEDARLTMELEQAYAEQVTRKTGKRPALPPDMELITENFEREVAPEGSVLDFALKKAGPAPVAKR